MRDSGHTGRWYRIPEPEYGAVRSQLQDAFTLIELLTTISIIGILAGLLVIGLNKAKERGFNAHCLNNLRQLGLVARFYADDANGRFPRILNPHLNKGELTVLNYAIRQTFRPIAKSDNVFHCKRDLSDNFFQSGSSYEWNQAWNGKLIDRTSSPLRDPLLSDSAPRHRSRNRRNSVFADGHVEGTK